jgi:hypothetical protein
LYIIGFINYQFVYVQHMLLLDVSPLVQNHQLYRVRMYYCNVTVTALFPVRMCKKNIKSDG